MKQLLLLALLLILFKGEDAVAQSDKAMLILNDSTTLQLERVAFVAAEHKLTYTGSAVTAIDGEPYFGSDGDVPRHRLTKAVLKVNDDYYYLQVDRMFNPWSDYPDSDWYTITRQGLQLVLRATFSDGAGYYGAEWILKDKKSTRTLLTDDESILIEYFEN